MNSVRYLLLACTITLLYSSSIVLAQESTVSKDLQRLEELSLEELLNVEISVASNVISDKDKQPVSITTITRRQLELSGARTLADALALFVPGFFVTDDQDDLIMAFRGLAPDNNSKVMLLINGQNMNMEFFWGPPYAILAASNYTFIERVEVIRGPGSVTLGQGALLGVINIVTVKGADLKPDPAKGDAAIAMDASMSVGLDNFLLAQVMGRARVGDAKVGFTVSRGAYGGQVYRNEGNARRPNEGFAGGTLFDMGHRLKRNDNVLLQGNIEYKGFEVNVLYTDNQMDLYNFYRDREVYGQTLSSVNLSYKHEFSKDVALKVAGSFIQDDIRLLSLTGVTMGGTREDRYGALAILTVDNLVRGNKLAVGVEYRLFEMGKKNRFGNNFIANVIGRFNPVTANQELTMGYRNDIQVISAFVEDFYSVNEQIDIFAAARFDSHTGWGTNLSPRVGVLFAAAKDLRFRLSYQMGFRGGVGLAYGGGYRNDGYLRSSNLPNIEAARIPGETNRPIVRPEIMNSIEFATTYQIMPGLKVDAVGFYNLVNGILDVGVIYKDPVNPRMPQPGQFNMVPIGSGATQDIPGDWNGFWFFKNALGTLNQWGVEATLAYNSDVFNVSLSHALVQVASVSAEQEDDARKGNSMYLTFDRSANRVRHKVYPENATRLNILATPLRGLDIALNGILYSDWLAPDGSVGKGTLLLNFGASYDILNNLEVSLNVANLANQTPLSPMNANASGPGLQAGAPTIETTTFWVRLRLHF
ncbi:MAG: TonB-dependent receptor [Bacteroidota bacterium]|nr:TonB-dependent receptor [Candidatus Kapabacteria bacterium]MDW8220698.1 TonB-dependent receptor [Bacteroidota bacterium]